MTRCLRETVTCHRNLCSHPRHQPLRVFAMHCKAGTSRGGWDLSPDQCWWGMWLLPSALAALSILSNLSTLEHAGLLLAVLSPSEWWAGGKPGCPSCQPVTECQVGCIQLLCSVVPSPTTVCGEIGLRLRPGLKIYPLDTTFLSSLIFNFHCCSFKGVCPSAQRALSGALSGVSDGLFLKSTFYSLWHETCKGNVLLFLSVCFSPACRNLLLVSLCRCKTISWATSINVTEMVFFKCLLRTYFVLVSLS